MRTNPTSTLGETSAKAGQRLPELAPPNPPRSFLGLALLVALSVVGCGQSADSAQAQVARRVTAEAAQADIQVSPKIAQIFELDTLGATEPYLEAMTGPAWREGDHGYRQYKVDGCIVGAGVDGGIVQYLQLEVTPSCTFELAAWLHNYRLPPLQTMRLGDLASQANGRTHYTTEYLGSCARAICPTPYLVFSGTGANGYLEVVLGSNEHKRVGEWAESLGEQVVTEPFPCAGPIAQSAPRYLADARVDTITIGRGLSGPDDRGCDVPYGAFAPKASDL